MFSALPSNSDIARRIRDVSKVPLADFPEHLNKVGFSSDIVGKEISDHGQGDSGRKF
jgi:hypothetical protein